MTFFVSYQRVLLHFNLFTLDKSSKLDSSNSWAHFRRSEQVMVFHGSKVTLLVVSRNSC